MPDAIGLGRGLGISGRGSNSAVSGVEMTMAVGAAKSTATSEGGYYEFIVVERLDCSITPSKEGCLFSPVKCNYTDVNADYANQNFTATRVIAETGGTEVIGGANGYIRPREGERAKILVKPCETETGEDEEKKEREERERFQKILKDNKFDFAKLRNVLDCA